MDPETSGHDSSPTTVRVVVSGVVRAVIGREGLALQFIEVVAHPPWDGVDDVLNDLVVGGAGVVLDVLVHSVPFVVVEAIL